MRDFLLRYVLCLQWGIFILMLPSYAHSSDIPRPVPIVYEITARKLDPEAVNTYPQHLLRIEQRDSACVIRVQVDPLTANPDFGRIKTILYDKDGEYPAEISRFLAPTALTDFNVPEIEHTVDSVLQLNNVYVLDVIRKLLTYSSQRIDYDSELAEQLDCGTCTTLPVEEILRREKGTCSEYTNLFLALARKAGIPSRMAIGYIYIPAQGFQGSHAWAECYLPGYGWLGVDPQNGFIGIPPTAVKLFLGSDFLDSGIGTLPEMYPVQVKIIEEIIEKK